MYKKIVLITILLYFYCFNTFTDTANISLLKIDEYRKLLKDKRVVNGPNGNGLSHLGKRSYIPFNDWPYLVLVINVYKAYPEKFGTVIRMSLVKKLLSLNQGDDLIEILLPIISEAKKRSVFWEYCSHWTFREARAKELEGLFLLTKLYLKNKNIDKALDVLKIIKQCYPFREKTIDSFLLFKDKVSKFNKEQKFEFYQLIRNQLILMESKEWEELGLSRKGYEWLKNIKKSLFSSKEIEEKPINVKFYKFEGTSKNYQFLKIIPK